jgi:hypothetical protein
MDLSSPAEALPMRLMHGHRVFAGSSIHRAGSGGETDVGRRGASSQLQRQAWLMPGSG